MYNIIMMFLSVLQLYLLVLLRIQLRSFCILNASAHVSESLSHR